MEEFNHKHYNYKFTKGFGLALLFVFILLLGSAFAQTSPNTPSGYSIDSTTGNLIPNGSLTSATGWSSTTGSPSWTPNGAPLGSFDPANGYTFSYIPESLGQNPGINLGSFNHGYLNSGAVFVTGFSYGLTYRFPCANSIGTNCDGTSQTAAPANPTQDNLRVEVGYYPSTGNPTFYTHQLGLKNINDGNPAYNPNWQTLAQTVTFAGAKPLAQAGSVNYEIIGSDAGGWACLNGECYGPQVKNAYIRANYSVDPCILNPAFNPNCSGFQNILQGSKSPAFYYSYNIAQSLPHIGGGVILHGYDYGFNWYNYGACYNTFMFWCTDWRTDGGGNINFRISDKNNTTMLQQQWYVSGNNNAGSYSNRYLFTESRNSLDMGTIQWWASDVWNHFGWVGWTRPIWTPDPCYTNGLYSPNCSNFQSTLTQTIADIKAQQEKIAALNTSSTAITPTVSVTTALNDVNSTNPSVVVTSVQTEDSNQSVVNNNFALNLIRQNQNRENNIATQSSQSAIKNANIAAVESINQAESLALTQAVKSNENNDLVTTSIVNTASKQTDNLFQVGTRIGVSSSVSIAQKSTTSQDSDLGIITTNTNTNVQTTSIENRTIPSNNVNVVNIGTTPTNDNQVNTQSQLITLLPPITNTQQNSITSNLYQQPEQQVLDIKTNENPQQEQKASNNFAVALVPPQTQSVEIQQPTQLATIAPVVNVDVPTTQNNFTTDKTNPINDLIENKTTTIEQDRKDTNTQQVKSNVQDNDAAVGVSINSIARTPFGFNTYLIALNDAAFYSPKEIYRNQKTVDNVRALRQLASDRLHQQMVDQQYLPR
jgi:hypothetical protein